MVLLATFVISTAAFAQHITDVPLDPILGKLSWGMPHDKVMNILEKELMAEFQTKASGNTDLAYADRLRKSYTETAENMKKSYIQLMKDNSGSLSVSIIGEEFAPDNSESMLTKREADATKYYFFFQDKLYKIAVVYDSNMMGNVSFDRYAGETSEKYGRAFSEGFDEEGFFMESTWKDKQKNCLTVKNKQASYNTFLSVYYSDEINKQIAPIHEEIRARNAAGPDVSADIDDLSSGTFDALNSNKNPVNDLIGSSTKIDLLAGLSQEEIDIIEGKITAEEAEKLKKKKAPKSDGKKKNDKKANQNKGGIVFY